MEREGRRRNEGVRDGDRGGRRNAGVRDGEREGDP